MMPPSAPPLTSPVQDEGYTCPICLDLCVFPTKLSSGHVFCQKCIVEWLKTNKHCPCTRQPIHEDLASLRLDQRAYEENLNVALSRGDNLLVESILSAQPVTIEEHQHQSQQQQQHQDVRVDFYLLPERDPAALYCVRYVLVCFLCLFFLSMLHLGVFFAYIVSTGQTQLVKTKVKTSPVIAQADQNSFLSILASLAAAQNIILAIGHAVLQTECASTLILNKRYFVFGSVVSAALCGALFATALWPHEIFFHGGVLTTSLSAHAVTIQAASKVARQLAFCSLFISIFLEPLLKHASMLARFWTVFICATVQTNRLSRKIKAFFTAVLVTVPFAMYVVNLNTGWKVSMPKWTY